MRRLNLLASASDSMPVLGLGTWRMGESAHSRPTEVAAVRRDELFIVTKVYPHNASPHGVHAALERSRSRLGVDCVDLYLLHWPSHEHPIADTVSDF